MNEENGRQFIEALYREVWCAMDEDKIDKFYSEKLSGFVDQQPVDYSNIKSSVLFLKERMETLTSTVTSVVAEKNRVAGVVNLKGIPLTGEPWFASMALFVDIEGGKIIKMRLFSSVTETVAAKNLGSPTKAITG
jgi:hypothetical protein